MKKEYKKTFNWKTNSGAFTLVLVLIVSTAIVVTLGAYLVVLTNLTRNSYNYIRSEDSYYSAVGSLKETMVQYIASQGLGESDPTSSTYTLNDQTQISRTITESDGVYSINITAVTRNLPRTIEATFIPAAEETAITDIILAIDVSNSMNENADPDNPGTTKLDKAIESAMSFVDNFNDNTTTRIGAVSYSTDVNVVHNLAYNDEFVTLKSDIANLSATGHTNIGGALELVKDLITADPQPEAEEMYVVLLTDGKPTVTSDDTSCYESTLACLASNPAAYCNLNVAIPCYDAASLYVKNEADDIKDYIFHEIKIFTIGLGTDDKIDRDLLIKTASPNDLGVTYFHQAPTADELQLIYDSVAKTILGLGSVSFQEPGI